MALYLGSNDGQKINLNGKTYCLNVLTKILITEGAILLSSDNYILQDSNGLYLTIKEGTMLLSSDNYILRDSNGLYLTIKEDI